MSCEMKELFCCINVKIHSKFLHSRLCLGLLLQMSFKSLKCLVNFNAFWGQINIGDMLGFKDSSSSCLPLACSFNVLHISTCARVQVLCKTLISDALDQIIDNT